MYLCATCTILLQIRKAGGSNVHQGNGIRRCSDDFLFKVPLNDLPLKRTRHSIYSIGVTGSAIVPTQVNNNELEVMDLDLEDMEQDLEQNSIPSNDDNLAWDHNLDFNGFRMDVEDQGLFDQYGTGSVNLNESQVRILSIMSMYLNIYA
jgi:hypothetical protein